MDAKVILGGRYELQSRLGEGGMATVYMALDRKLDRKVAVKVLHSHMEKNDEIRHRFHQEAKTISSLNHPNILKIYDFSGVSSKKLWIVTEIIHGNSLSEYIQKYTSGTLHTVIAAAIVRETAKALSAAHERGVIHRDIKPENIMLTEKGKVKLMDFGISKDMRDHSVTQTGTFMGAPSYMSPEQVVSGPLDIRTDTYSLGIVFYEIITGRLPFIANTTSDLIRKIRSGDFVEPKYLRPRVQDELNDLICDCMATSRDDRPEEVSFVGQNIEHFLARLGFVESHVELERYFKDRVSFEARLRAVESEQAMQPKPARQQPRTNHLKTEYIRAKANKGQQKNRSRSQNISRNSRSTSIPNSPPNAGATKYQNSVQAGSILQPPSKQTQLRNAARHEAMQRRAYEAKMQNRAAQARKQRMKAYQRAMEAQAYKRTENIADANALWNGAVALIVFAVLGIGFYELLKVDSRIKKQQIEQSRQPPINQNYYPGQYNPQDPRGQRPNPVVQKPIQNQPRQVIRNPTPNLNRRPGQQISAPIVTPNIPQNQPQQNQPSGNVTITQGGNQSSNNKTPTWIKSPKKKTAEPPKTEPTKTRKRVDAIAQEIKNPTPVVSKEVKLKLRSSPAARIFVNNKAYGTTVDQTSSSKWVVLSAGTHEIRLTREGYKDHKQTVKLKNGDELFLPLIRLTEQAPVVSGTKTDKDVSFKSLYSLIIETNQLPLKVYVKPLEKKGKSKSLTMKKGRKTFELPAGRYRIETSWNGQRKSRDVTLPGPQGSKNITYFVSH